MDFLEHMFVKIHQNHHRMNRNLKLCQVRSCVKSSTWDVLFPLDSCEKHGSLWSSQRKQINTNWLTYHCWKVWKRRRKARDTYCCLYVLHSWVFTVRGLLSPLLVQLPLIWMCCSNMRTYKLHEATCGHAFAIEDFNLWRMTLKRPETSNRSRHLAHNKAQQVAVLCVKVKVFQIITKTTVSFENGKWASVKRRVYKYYGTSWHMIFYKKRE